MVAEARQLGLTIDGLPLQGADPAAYATQAALASLDPDDAALLEWLRRDGAPAIGIVDAHFDDVPLWLGALGLPSRMLAGEDLADSDAQIAFVACPHRFARLDRAHLDRFFDRGGVLVTSDRATMIDGVAAYLPDQGGRPPRRARLRLEGDDTSSEDPAVLPAVWLHGGYRALDLTPVVGPQLRILASDSLTGEPLVVALRARNGLILHSVAHWIQIGVDDHVTALDRRPLRSIPCYAAIGNSFPNLSLGNFLTAQVMLRLWLSGIKEQIGTLQARQAEARR